ncbi:MAG: hypothetical protein KBH99_05780 [Syntrophobacteraceae bacterium]|nr:hypothetical protein [Syntrophobacteraceae bacterium]
MGKAALTEKEIHSSSSRPTELCSGMPCNARRNESILRKAAWQGVIILALASVLGLLGNEVRRQRLPWIDDRLSQDQAVRSSLSEGIVISLEEAAALFWVNGAVFIDARSEEAFRAGHIAGARNLPWQDFENRFQETMENVPLDSILIIYCDGDTCTLSKDLAFALLGKGYPFVRVLVNGWTLWKEANLPVEKLP